MNITLYIIAFLEGFTTLSVEIMAIRNSIAIIGSNAIATSIILGVVLLALSYGYYRGGIYAAYHTRGEVQRKIYYNLLIAALFYTLVSFPFENSLLEYTLSWGIGYFFPVLITISVLFILPVFLASQTIPLLSELVSGEDKAIVIGKLLFFSTMGSFLGSVVTSLVFFAYFGVERSIIINGIILSVLAIIMARSFVLKVPQWILILNISYLCILIFALSVDPREYMIGKNTIYRGSTQYNNIAIHDDGRYRLFSMNGSNSSGLDTLTGESYFSYIQAVTALIDQEKPKKILIIGAAGFTLPQAIAKRSYIETIDVVDIDGALDTIATEYFLEEPLHPKIDFYKQSARHFLREKIRSSEKYDFIFIDAYNGRISIPSELLTVEFFQNIEKLSSDIITMNVIIDPLWESDFAGSLLRTLSVSFSGGVFLQSKSYDTVPEFDNVIIANRAFSGYTQPRIDNTLGIYTDNQNTLEIDKYRLFYRAGYN